MINLDSSLSSDSPYLTEDLNGKFETTTKKLDPTSSFFATFVDGSSFRYMIEYLRLPSIEGVFRFSRDKIVYEQEDSDKNILNKVELKVYELTEYEYKSTSDEIVVGINLSEIRNICRNVGKKDHIDLYKLPDEPKNLYIQIRSQTEKSEPNIYMIPITTTNYVTYQIPPYSRPKQKPTCTVHQNDFSKLCKSLVTINCDKAKIHGFNRGVVFKGITKTGAIGSVKEFGKMPKSKGPTMKSIMPSSGKVVKSSKPPPKLNIGEMGEVENFKIPISIIKVLVKINALSPTGTIKIYIEKGLPLKMLCNVGTFGKLTIYLMGD